MNLREPKDRVVSLRGIDVAAYEWAVFLYDLFEAEQLANQAKLIDN